MVKREKRPAKRTRSSETTAESAHADDTARRSWVVVLGSSAGGLAALQEFLGHLPNADACALIVAQHLAPGRESALVEILARATSIPVLEASDGTSLAPGAIYVVPPNAQATVRGGALRLGNTAQQPSRHSIDRLLTSVAQDAGEHAVAVILSGTGSDGSEGTEAVRQMGGMTFAQTEDSAQFADMPRHAVETGCVDLVLAPAAIARELTRLTHAEAIPASSSSRSASPGAHDPIDVGRTLDLVQSVTGLDLGCLNASHVERRIARRALLSGLGGPAEYMSLLAVNPSEVVNLKGDLLIGVTSFFRDPEAFAALRERAFPRLLDRRDPGDTIRIWVPGCATGEEVFSIAMALADFCAERAPRVQFQIFGTDLNDAAIATARAAIYREASLDDLPAGYANRFFKRVEHGYQIDRDLRERCVFAVHNAFTDPPLSRLDLISCRNLLIYASPPFQQRLLSTFHFALKPGGLLFLGASESVGTGSELFAAIDRRQRLFLRKSGTGQLPARRGRRPLEPVAAGPRTAGATWPTAQDANRPSDAVEEALLDHFAPKDFVVVDREFQILRFHGKAGRFLAPATGQASLNLLRLVEEDLALDLRLLLHQASVPGAGETTRSVLFRGAGREPSRITLQAIPVPPRDENDGLVIVAFRAEPQAAAAQGAETPAAAGDGPARARELAEELTLTRELLRQVVDDQEVVRDDVNNATVELQSTNEELQTTNEELETAKEELQATNEELHTVNQELQVRNQELNQVNTDLGNLLASSEIPIVMLDDDLRVRRFTPSAVTLLRLSPQDVGRDIRDLRTSPDLDEVLPLLRDVLAGRDAPEVELHARDGRWYSARLLPYFDAENRIDGVVMALVDVDAIRRSLAVATEARDYARAVIDTVRSPLLELDAGLRVRVANPCFYETFATRPDDVVGHSLPDLADGAGNNVVREQLATLMADAREIRDLEVDFRPDDGPVRKLLCDAREVRGGSSGDRRILVSVRDVTAERALADAQRERGEALAAADRAKDAFLAQLSHELRTPLAAIIGWSQHILEGNLSADEQLGALQSILRNALAQLQLVGDLLDVSRALNGTLTLSVRRVSLRKVLTESRDAVAPAARTKSIAIELLAPADLPEVTADPDRMRQVVVNLLTNAVKFTPERGRIRIKLRATAAEQNITVTDNGAGITAEQLPLVFERYYQATPDGKTGLGLGLSLVHDIVALHGGTVEAASGGPGKGATFTVHLPLAPGGAPGAQ